MGIFFPTKSARIGNSLWPLSIKTASLTIDGLPKLFISSSAALIVLPEKRTSSIKITTLFSSEKGMFDPRISGIKSLSR